MQIKCCVPHIWICDKGFGCWLFFTFYFDLVIIVKLVWFFFYHLSWKRWLLTRDSKWLFLLIDVIAKKKKSIFVWISAFRISHLFLDLFAVSMKSYQIQNIQFLGNVLIGIFENTNKFFQIFNVLFD